MELSLDLLKEAGAFAPAKPEQTEINWTAVDGTEHKATVHVVKKSFATAAREIQNHAGTGFGEHMAGRIAASIVDANGKPIFTTGDVLGNDDHGPMCDSLGWALIDAINRVNGFSAEPDPKP